jgi:hypothetical protein
MASRSARSISPVVRTSMPIPLTEPPVPKALSALMRRRGRSGCSSFGLFAYLAGHAMIDDPDQQCGNPVKRLVELENSALQQSGIDPAFEEVG